MIQFNAAWLISLLLTWTAVFAQGAPPVYYSLGSATYDGLVVTPGCPDGCTSVSDATECQAAAVDLAGTWSGSGSWGTETGGCLSDGGAFYWNAANAPLAQWTDNIVEDDEFPVCVCEGIRYTEVTNGDGKSGFCSSDAGGSIPTLYYSYHYFKQTLSDCQAMCTAHRGYCIGINWMRTPYLRCDLIAENHDDQTALISEVGSKYDAQANYKQTCGVAPSGPCRCTTDCDIRSVRIKDANTPSCFKQETTGTTTTTTSTTTTTTTTTTAPACNQFQCAAHSPDSAQIPSASSQHGYSFDVCCRCRYGQHLLYGAVAEGDFNEDSKEMSMWIDAPTHIEMTKITWTNGANNDLAFGEGSVGAWVVSSPNHNGNTDQCRTRYTLTRDIDVFFGTGTHFTYNKAKDYLEGMVKLEGDRPMHTTVAGRDKSYMRHMIQDVPVHVALNKTTTVSATFSMATEGEHETYIMITGVSELTSGENGDITLNMNILSPSCMQESVTLIQISQEPNFVNGDIQATWDASTLYQYDDPTTDHSLCSQDVTVVFQKADDQWSAKLEFQFQERGASDGEYVNENVDIQITKPHILDSLPIRSTMAFHKLSSYADEAQVSFGLGQMVYGEILTTTVVTVDDIQLTRLVLNQINYAGTPEDTDIMHLSWAKYSGAYNSRASNSFRFAFDLESTHFHVTETGQLATIFADFTVTYLDGAETHRRRYLQEIPLGSQQAVGSFAITASEVASEVTPGTYEFLTQTVAPYAGMAAAGVFAIACCYYKEKLNSNKLSYERLLDQDEI